MVVKCKLAHGLSYEVNLAIQMLDCTTHQVLLIYDRGYASYEFLATLTQQHKNYIVRCPISSFKAIQSLVSAPENWSKVVTLKPPSNQKKNMYRYYKLDSAVFYLHSDPFGLSTLNTLCNIFEKNSDSFRFTPIRSW